MQRLTPFELVFESAAQTTFPSIRSALEQARQDPRDRDSFLMLREVVSLMRDLRPEEGLGEAVDQLAALVHHSYLFWAAGSITLDISRARLERLLGDEPEPSGDHPEPPSYYVQLPERRVWAEVIPGQSHEPLDGCFVYRDLEPASLRVLGIFGVYRDRPGFSVAEVSGPRSIGLARADGSRLFAPTLAGGSAAQLFSVAGGEELLELGWRTTIVGSRESGVWSPGASGPLSGSLYPTPSS
jgi:hypothetical protein